VTAPPITTTITLPLEPAKDNYGMPKTTVRWVLPWSVTLTGSFRHCGPYTTYNVSLFENVELARKWHGNRGPEDMQGSFSAEAAVIASHYYAKDYVYRIPVGVGTVVRTVLGRFEVRDDWMLNYPYLVKVVDA
jgi:hypothetical protein